MRHTPFSIPALAAAAAQPQILIMSSSLQCCKTYVGAKAVGK